MKRALPLLTAALLSACGAGGSAIMQPPIVHGGTAPVAVRLIVPRSKGTSSTARHVQFIAATTQGVDVRVYAQSDTGLTTMLAETAADISSGSSACGGTTGTPRTCTFTIAAPLGADAFVVRTYDAPPAGGNFTGAKQLAAASVDQTIAAGTANTLNFTLGGVVAALWLQLPIPNLRGTLPASERLGVAALDADGNTIVTDDFVDANGNAVQISLSQSTPNGPNGGAVTISPAVLSAPSATGVLLSYDGNAGCGSASTCDGAFSDTIGASAGSATASSVVLNINGPSATLYPIAGAAGQNDIVAGPDGNLWFTYGTSPAAIGRMTLQGVVTLFPLPALEMPQCITVGPDGNLWFTEAFGGNVGKVTPGGAITEYAVGSTGVGIASGPDGNLWFALGASIVKMSTSGTILAAYPTPSGNDPLGVTAGPDGNIWFTEGPVVGKLVISSGSITEYPSGVHAPSGLLPSNIGNIVTGPDANLWVVYTYLAGIGEAGAVLKMTPSGVGTLYTSSQLFRAIMNGPDGNMWALGATVGLTRVRTDGTLQSFTSGVPAAAVAGGGHGCAAAADGNLWCLAGGLGITEFSL